MSITGRMTQSLGSYFEGKDMDLYTKNGRPLQISGDKVYSRSGKIVGRIKDEKVFGTDGRYVGTIVSSRLVYRPSHCAAI